MYLNKKGFLLTDALVCVFIVCVMALVISSAIIVYTGSQKRIYDHAERVDEKMKQEMEKVDKCEICTSPPATALP